MTVYVDDVEHRFGRMLMSHMWADTEAAKAVFEHLVTQSLFNPNFPTYPRFRGHMDIEKSVEAMDCAQAMFAYRKARVANQSVKEQGDGFTKTANSPGERG